MSKISDKDITVLKGIWKSFKKIHYQLDHLDGLVVTRSSLQRTVNMGLLNCNPHLPEEWDGEMEVRAEMTKDYVEEQEAIANKSFQLEDAIKFCQFRDEYKVWEQEGVRKEIFDNNGPATDEKIYKMYLEAKKGRMENHNDLLRFYSEDH